MAAAELELLMPDDVGLESTLLGGAGAILTSFDFTPRAAFVTLPDEMGDTVLLLLLLLLLMLATGTILLLLLLLLLVGDALIVMDLVVITVELVELAPYGAGDGVPEARSNSIMAS